MIRMLTNDELASVPGGEAGFGTLETEKGCLPLVALDLDVQIDGLTAHGTVSQCFKNVFAGPLEATYIFPLPPRAAVIGFRMIVNGAVIEGRIDERAQARADYDAAIARGQSAAIAEEERADVFTVRVGNIPAGALARVEFTLVEPLARAAAAVGIDGVFFETHPDPDTSPSDGPNMVPLDRLGGVIERVLRIHEARLAGESA